MKPGELYTINPNCLQLQHNPDEICGWRQMYGDIIMYLSIHIDDRGHRRVRVLSGYGTIHEMDISYFNHFYWKAGKV